MANKKKTMQQIRQILQSHLRGDGIKSIVRQTGIQRNTVRDYIRRWQASGVDPASFSGLDDSALARAVFRPAVLCPRQLALDAYLTEHLKELKRRGMTRQLLWHEYTALHPDGYRYTQFCEHLGRHQLHQEAVLRFEHRGGDKMLVDFAGGTLKYIEGDREVECQVFVATMPCSGMVFVLAVPSQSLGDFVHCLGRALEYFGGVPACILSDNLRSAVKRADRYEADLTDALEQLGLHYNCTMMATRAYKPRDKAHVERHVSIVYQQVYAPLRHQTFHGLGALNAAIQEQVGVLCLRPYQGKDGETRQSLFDRLDAPALRPLPTTCFEIKHTVGAKVQRDYHVLLGADKHFYSVPFQHIGKEAQMVYDGKSVDIYIDNQCVASHARIRSKGRSSSDAHRPPNHLHQLARQKMGQEAFVEQALKIGPHCVKVIQRLWESTVFVDQKVRSSLGIISLSPKFGAERLEKACARALYAPKPSYAVVRNILNNNLDKAPGPVEEPPPTIPEHHNIRGARAYS